MTKTEYLGKVRHTLSGGLPSEIIEKEMKYYEEYFETSPKSEEEVCEELGDPTLIAKTLLSSYESKGSVMGNIYEKEAREEYANSHRSSDDTYNEDGSSFSDGVTDKESLLFRLIFDRGSLKWYEKVLVFAVGILIAALIVCVAILLVKFTINVVIPIIIAFFVVGFIMYLIERIRG